MSERSWARDVMLAVGGGVVGAFGVWLLNGPPAADVKPSEDPASEQNTDVTAAEPASGEGRRVAALERRIADLERKITTRARLQNYADRLANEGGAGAQADRSRPATVDAEDPVFELAVRSVIDRATYERDLQRRDDRSDRREQRVEGQIEFLTDRLGLSEQQVTKVEEILLAQMETFMDLRDSEDRPRTRREWREKGGAIRAETRTKLTDVLDEDQLKDYDEIRAEDNSRRRR